jgi:F0F1-type ATP synthase assembly protein I
MSLQNPKEGKSRTRYTLNLALAVVAGQVGCVTIVIIGFALLGGLWLDNRFDSSPIFLATLLIASVPVTVILMLWIVRSVTARIKTANQAEKSQPEEEANRGTDA